MRNSTYIGPTEAKYKIGDVILYDDKINESYQGYDFKQGKIIGAKESSGWIYMVHFYYGGQLEVKETDIIKAI